MIATALAAWPGDLAWCASESPAGRPDSPTTEPATWFEDVTERMGLAGLGNTQAAWVDFNKDGWVDLYVDGQLWLSESGKRFRKAKDLPIAGPGIWADFDNDGLSDFFSWADGGKLYRNVGGGKVVDAGKQLPKLPMAVSRGAAWGDLDGDGLLDLYVGGFENPHLAPQPSAMCANTGKGGFTLVWKTAGRCLPARGVAACDYNEDGKLDVYVSNYRLAPNLLLRGEGKGNFTNVAFEAGVAGDAKPQGLFGHTIGSAWGDLDNDGHMDLFVGNFSHPPQWQDRPKFYRNMGPGGGWRFEDKTKAASLAWQESYATPTLADFDNDGLTDLYFTTVYQNDHCVLYRNKGDWAFADATASSGVAAKLTYQAACADFDNDGRVDLVTGGRLYRNRAGGGHWVEVSLAGDGKRINRDAIGAQVRLRMGERTLTRQVEGSTGEGNQNGLTLHFGLGTWDRLVELEIRWPDGTRQTATAKPGRIAAVRYAGARPRVPSSEPATRLGDSRQDAAR